MKSSCVAIKDKIPPLELNCDATKRNYIDESPGSSPGRVLDLTSPSWVPPHNIVCGVYASRGHFLSAEFITSSIPVLVDWFLYCIFPVKDAEYKIMYVDWFCGLENWRKEIKR
ncbi:hypothetical protein KY284_007128 [Solanum tuberosum]|nr:hypothetical protein KY284_007128 [Solanum tuberosum]